MTTKVVEKGRRSNTRNQFHERFKRALHDMNFSGRLEDSNKIKDAKPHIIFDDGTS
jgi:hypothetical protein